MGGHPERGPTCLPAHTHTHRPSPPRRNCHHWQAHQEGHVVPWVQRGKHVSQHCCPAVQGRKRTCPGWTWSPSTGKTDRTLAASPEHCVPWSHLSSKLSCFVAFPIANSHPSLGIGGAIPLSPGCQLARVKSPFACFPIIASASLPDFSSTQCYL